MRLNFKKVSAIAASALMVGMTMGVAAAANYPNPFVVSGAADVAVVYGTGAGVSSLDLVQAGNIQSNLQSYMTGSSSSSASVTGEAAELFSGGTKIYLNDSLSTVKNVLTATSLPTVLADGSFSGNVEATFTQKITLGSDPKVTFKKQPTSSDDPNLALSTYYASSGNKEIYNTTVTFNKALNLSHADSEGEELEILGSTFTIGSATDENTLVLLKSAEKVDLSSDSSTAQVTIAGAAYTIELVSASDTTATIKVTDASGNSASKEVNEAGTKKINGLTVAVTNADENNLKYSASIIAGSEKVTLESGASVEVGEDDSAIDGTYIYFGGTDSGTNGVVDEITSLTVSVYAPESDLDAIRPGESFTDPVFGTFKLDFSGFNIDSAVGSTSSSRDMISFSSSGDNSEVIKFTDHRGYEKSVQYAHNITSTGAVYLQAGDNLSNIAVYERKKLHKNDYVVVGNEDEGYLLELTTAKNATTTGVSSDKVEFKDVFSGASYEATMTDDGTGTLQVGGKEFAVTLEGIGGLPAETYNVSLGYPDSSGNGVAVLFPTIETSKGAKVAFYEPVTLTLTAWDGTNALTEIKFPDGDGYESVSSFTKTADASNWTFVADGVTKYLQTNITDGVVVTMGELTYNITSTGTDNQTRIYLLEADGTGSIAKPAVVIFEEKDDNAAYEALIVETDVGGNSDNGMGIDSVEFTWDNAGNVWSSTRYSDSKQADKADLFGTIVTIDSSDSDQATATISYPGEQVYAMLYMAEESATITAGTTTGATQLGDVLVKDSEVSSVGSKNLVVVGGSCINSVAANLVGNAACSADFTTKTGIGSGQFLIQSYTSPYSSSKVALLVAGYEAADTVNAATYLRTQTVDTTVGKKYKGTSSTAATLEVA